MTDEPDKAKRVRQSVTAALLAALLCLSASAQPQTITGKVVGVSDGDTITVLDADLRQHKVRLVGIDSLPAGVTPRRAHDAEAKCKSFTAVGGSARLLAPTNPRDGR
jgi:endonuclease YncB( thermonuclease family)